MPRKHRAGDHVVGHLAMVHAMCMTREQLFYDDLDVTDLDGSSTALDVDGPSPPLGPLRARSSAKALAIQQITQI